MCVCVLSFFFFLGGGGGAPIIIRSLRNEGTEKGSKIQRNPKTQTGNFLFGYAAFPLTKITGYSETIRTRNLNNLTHASNPNISKAERP